MKVKILAWIGCLLMMLTCSSVQAQKRKESAAAGAAAGALVIGAAIFEFHQFLEMLENEAADRVMQDYPEYECFRLKVLDLDGKKLSDVGSMSVITFRLTSIDKSTMQELNRSILMMLTSDGWMNANGVDFSFVSWQMMTTEEWNDMFVAFVEMSAVTSVNLDSMTFECSDKILKKDFDRDNPNHYQSGSNFFVKRPGQMRSLSETKFGRLGLEVFVPYENGGGSWRLALPFYALKNDDYIVTDYSNEMRLFANERSMGIFLKNTGESLQLQRSLVSEIHSFLNE